MIQDEDVYEVARKIQTAIPDDATVDFILTVLIYLIANQIVLNSIGDEEERIRGLNLVIEGLKENVKVLSASDEN
jgi:hypothetical protein